MSNSQQASDQIDSTSKKRSLEHLTAAELSWKLKSKQDFYVYLDKHQQYYLPPFSQVNKDFLRQVFKEEKKLLKKQQVSYIHVPKYDELSVKSLWPTFKDDLEFTSFFPETFAESKFPAREFFFNILNSVHGDYLAQVIAHANKERMAAGSPRVLV